MEFYDACAHQSSPWRQWREMINTVLRFNSERTFKIRYHRLWLHIVYALQHQVRYLSKRFFTSIKSDSRLSQDQDVQVGYL